MNAPMIDPSARIAAGAVLGRDCTIGAYCTVGPKVTLGDGCRLVSHVNISGVTSVGARTIVYPFASLGTPPQSVKYRGGETRLTIGADCDIREHVTINAGTEDGGGHTRVGDKCFLMVGSHVGHDCQVGNGVTIANNVLLAGHVEVGDNAVFGGGAAVRQFVRIGEGAMIVGMSGARADVIPWGLLMNAPMGELAGLNVVGLRRKGFGKNAILSLRRGYETLFFGAGHFRDRLDRLEAESRGEPLIERMVAFIRAGKRPLSPAIRRNQDDEDI